MTAVHSATISLKQSDILAIRSRFVWFSNDSALQSSRHNFFYFKTAWNI